MTISAAFIMEQHIGHRAYYENLRRSFATANEIEARWVEVTYEDPASWWSRLPFLPETVRGSLSGRAQVREGLQRQPYDVAIFNTQVPAALGGAPVRRRPYVLCTDITPLQYDRVSAFYGHRPDGSGPLHRYKHWLNGRLFRGAARVLPWSSWAARSIVDEYGVEAGRVEVLPPGVDTEVWRPRSSPSRRRLRTLFVGGDFQRKGGNDLLRAIDMLPKDLFELIVVTRSNVPSRPNMTVYHHLQPNSPELIALYQSCDVFVLPTKAEAFGIALVEASAVGLPVIATSVGGIADIVRHGETGFLIEPADHIALARHLKRLAGDPTLRNRLSRAARAHVVSHFDAEVNSARLAQVVREIFQEDLTQRANPAPSLQH